MSSNQRFRSVIVLVFPAIAIAFSAGAAVPASRTPLFAQTGPSAEARPAHVRAARSVKINRAAFGATNIEVDLFGQQFVAVRDRIEYPRPGGIVWVGHLQDQTLDSVILTMRGSTFSGMIQHGSRMYRIGAGRDGNRLLELDLNSMPLDDVRGVRHEDFNARRTEASPDVIGEVVRQDLLVAYNQPACDAATSCSQLEADIITAVADMNTIYAESEIAIAMSLVAMAKTEYSGGTLADALRALRDTQDGAMDELHELRDQVGADLVALVYAGEGCGLGYQLASEATAFTVTEFSCLVGNRTMTHEIGHNQGAHHDRVSAGAGATFDFNFGYRRCGDGSAEDFGPPYFRTVMAYPCSAAPEVAPRVGRISNPEVYYLGVPQGIDPAVQPTDGAFNARVLNATAGTVANFRAATEQIIIQPGPEQGIDAYVTNIYQNYEGYRNYIRVGGWGDYYYGLIKFNLAGLPTSATRAVIRLYATVQPGYVPMYLDRVTSAWDESVRWEGRPTFSNVRTLPATEPSQWYEIDVTDMYNAWQFGNVPNYGIQLRPASAGAPWNEWANFYSSDFPDDPSLRPQLVVYWGGSGPSLSLSKPVVVGCKSVSGRLTLRSPAPAGGLIVSVSDTLEAATAPATVRIAEGATTKSFTIKTTPVAASESGTVTVNVGGAVSSQPLTVRPIGLSSVTLSPSTVVGGRDATGTATLECAAGPGPVTVALSTSNAAVAHPVAATVVVPQALKSQTFTVATNPVLSKSSAMITGEASTTTKSRRLNVAPAAAVSPTRLQFGSVSVGQTSAAMVATLRNDGVAPFAVNSIGLTGTYTSWFAQTSNCPASLNPGASCTISVTFRPQAALSKSAKLSITTSATTTPLSVSLSGTGI